MTRLLNDVPTHVGFDPVLDVAATPAAFSQRAQQVVVVGTGYVGCVTAAGLAELAALGGHVHAVDIDPEKISLLKRGQSPIYEAGLDQLLSSGLLSGNLSFGTNLAEAIADADVVFIAVPTPPDASGKADLSFVMAVAREIGRSAQRSLVVVTKSTVPVGTACRIQAVIDEELRARADQVQVEVASNPEFLREGSAVHNFLYPDRIIVGAGSTFARDALHTLYRPLTNAGCLLIDMDVASAELTKYAANAMLATRISFMNQMATLCEFFDADVELVKQGIGTDPRIGRHFLDAGVGFGGSCFPKDLRALVQTAAEVGIDLPIARAASAVNLAQPHVVVEKLQLAMNLVGAKITVLGIAFKSDTDDIRESPALTIVEDLLAAGAVVTVHDPEAKRHFDACFGTTVDIADSELEALAGADACVVVTAWRDYLKLDPSQVAAVMAGRLVLDGRNVLDARVWADSGFTVLSIGRRVQLPLSSSGVQHTGTTLVE
jgi:UDPglucose 6-dehydrogenase